ncbi:MAG: hypothetical protein PVF58_09510 [Candidatus Methanofastidiosia archaeon]|jgi:hypothetical protein
MKGEFVECMEVFLKNRIRNYHIEVRRGDTHSLATHFVDYYLPLTLPCVSDMKDNLKQKMLYCLWGLVLDDCIDNGGDAQNLLRDTIGVLSYLPMKKKVNPQTPAGKTMDELVRRILAEENRNSDIGQAFFFLDALNQVKAFTYENIIHKKVDMATLFEYEEHSAITKDLRICLDIDICTTKKKILLPNTIKKLREAFKFFGLALTYQGDIATFESEFFIEKSLNSVLIRGLENSILPLNVLDLETAKKDEILKEVIPPLFDEVKKRMLEYRDLTMEKLKEVKELDISPLEQAFLYFINKEFPGAKMERIPTSVK